MAELTGAAAASRIVLAAPITLAEIEARFADKIEDREAVTFDAASASLRAGSARGSARWCWPSRSSRSRRMPRPRSILAQGIAGLGIGKLPWSKPQLQLRNRVSFLRRSEGEEWPDLVERRAGARRPPTGWRRCSPTRPRAREIAADDLSAALDALLPWTLRRRLDAEAPTHFTAPSGSHVPIDYEAEEGPKLSIRVQELFGLAKHPAIAGGRVPLVIELLSPAHRPVQVTRDLPGFWRGSYADVKAEMRGRYPRHPWPDDPLTAPATRRAKRRGE